MDYVYERYNQRHRPDKGYENRDFNEEDELLTEQAFMSTKDQIQRFKTAGILLQEFKRGVFDVEEGEEGE